MFSLYYEVLQSAYYSLPSRLPPLPSSYRISQSISLFFGKSFIYLAQEFFIVGHKNKTKVKYQYIMSLFNVNQKLQKLSFFPFLTITFCDFIKFYNLNLLVVPVIFITFSLHNSKSNISLDVITKMKAQCYNAT